MNITFLKTFGGSGGEYAKSVVQTSDGGYISAGWTSTHGSGNFDMLVIKTDQDGELEWARAMGGSDEDKAYDVIETTDGAFVVIGFTKSFGNGIDNCLIVKLSTVGGLNWASGKKLADYIDLIRSA